MADRVALFRDYLEKKPGDRFAMYSLAFELAKAERFEEAEQAFVELLQAHPHSGAGHFQLGQMYVAAGREDDAEAAWEAGLEALKGASGAEVQRSRVEIQAALDLL